MTDVQSPPPPIPPWSYPVDGALVADADVATDADEKRYAAGQPNALDT